MKTEVAIQLITHALENIGFNSPFKFFHLRKSKSQIADISIDESLQNLLHGLMNKE
ncbi:hypothetical protein HID58_017610 [Brassica napus]|uniref:Uncharacterized protein n=1 Tax=Brassica napus TaxID=3708 RepID=A0ABQ8D7M9_BRANA|nr:hypothetical protein HID58_017610 [Brassica napus]